MLHTYILYCDTRPIFCIRTVCKFSKLLLFTNIMFILVQFFFGDCHNFTSRKVKGEAKKGWTKKRMQM